MTGIIPLEVCIDLEETIINNWFDGHILYQTTHIRRWLNHKKVTKLNVWSFAINDQRDKDEFEDCGMKQSIENILNRPIIEYPSVDEMIQLVHHYEHIHYDSVDEFRQLNGKAFSFIKYCLGWKKDAHVVLIDDVIPNMKVEELDRNLTIELINVNSPTIKSWENVYHYLDMY